MCEGFFIYVLLGEKLYQKQFKEHLAKDPRANKKGLLFQGGFC